MAKHTNQYSRTAFPAGVPLATIALRQRKYSACTVVAKSLLGPENLESAFLDLKYSHTSSLQRPHAPDAAWFPAGRMVKSFQTRWSDKPARRH
jgi:hypothetical protein